MITTATALPSVFKDYFILPKRIVKDFRLCRLSGDALALYLFLAHSLYRCRKQATFYTNSALSGTLDMPLDIVSESRQELRAYKLIGYKPSKNGFFYWFSNDEPLSPTPTPQTQL